MNILETDNGNLVVSIPIVLKTISGRRRCFVSGVHEVHDLNNDECGVLVRSFARAYGWTKLLDDNTFDDVKSLAVALKMDRSNVARIMRLATLSPRILRAVLRHELPAGFSVEKLYNIKSDIWSDQEAEIGLTPLS